MSYITSSFSPYRSKDLGKEFSDILAEDCEWICSSFKDKGLIFVLAFITLMFMSLLKAIVFLFEEMGKPQASYSHLSLSRNRDSVSITSLLTRREVIDDVDTQNHDNICPNDRIKNEQFDSLHTLRRYLYQHDLTLHAQVLKTINHRVSNEELAEMYRLGEITKPLSTTHITFGDDLNTLLKNVLNNLIDLKTNKITQETYIKVLNDDYYPIQERLRTLYNEPIKITFD